MGRWEDAVGIDMQGWAPTPGTVGLHDHGSEPELLGPAGSSPADRPPHCPQAGAGELGQQQ